MANPAVHLIAFGAATPVGASLRVALAAVQGGLSRIFIDRDPGDADEDDPDANHVARVATLDLEATPARAQALLAQAVGQVLAECPALAQPSLQSLVQIFVAAPASLDAAPVVARLLGGRAAGGVGSAGGARAAGAGGAPAPRVEMVGGHGSSALIAVERAARALARGEIELALVAAVDVRTDAAALAAGLAAERIIGPARAFGHVPGEAAAAVLLASERGLGRLGVASRGTVLAAAVAREPNPIGSKRPCVGVGVTQAVQQVLASLPAGAVIDDVVCDLNGERGRTDEWGFTVPRVAARLRQPEAFVAPATAWGDCGAANGLLLLALGTSIAARREPAGGYLLVWTSSDDDERAAVLVHAPAPASGPTSEPAARPRPVAWADELDDEILGALADEGAFRHDQRAYQLNVLAGEELVSDWSAVERIEETADGLVAGLAGCGGRARAVVAAAIDPESPGTGYVAARTFLEAGELAGAVALAVEHAPASPALAEAIARAFQHARGAAVPGDRGFAALLAGGAAVAPVTLAVAAASGARLPVSALAAAIEGVPPAGAAACARALGEVGGADALPLLDRWVAAADPVVRREVGIAQLRLGGAAVAVELLERSTRDEALLIPAALAVDGARVARLVGRATARKSPETILAAGLAADPGAVPWLLDRLLDPSTARDAAVALEILLGEPPIEEQGVADEEEPESPARRVRRISRSIEAWGARAARVLPRHPAGQRLRAGVAATAAATVGLVARPHLPALARRYLACELAIRWGVPGAFDPEGLVRVQRAWLAGAERAAAAHAPGSWDLARRA